MMFNPFVRWLLQGFVMGEKMNFIPSVDPLQDHELLPYLENAIQIPLFQN